MSSIDVEKFGQLKTALQNITKNDPVSTLEVIKQQIVKFAPDINTLVVARLFNRTVSRTRKYYEQNLLIDLQHIQNLITLRKANFFAQSLVNDIGRVSYAHALLAQVDWSLYRKAHAIADREVEKSKRRFYVNYFNTEVLARIETICPELANDKLDFQVGRGYLTPLSEEEESVQSH